MSFDSYFGEALGLKDGLHSIGSGYAALIGLVVVAIGWVITGRQQKDKIRVESARSTIMIENERFQKYVPVIAPYFSKREKFPSRQDLDGAGNKDLSQAIHRKRCFGRTFQSAELRASVDL